MLSIFLVAGFQLQAKGSVDIVVMSDPHLLSPELITRSGKAIDNCHDSDMRMIKQSDEIMKALVAQVKTIKPRLLLITGDITKDGELLSHKRMVSYLDQLQTAGIKTLVIPGNHDIKNPFAKYFDGDKTHDAPTVGPQQFMQLYNNYGYGSSSRLDTASLSYACEPIPGLVVIGIDSNRHEDHRLKSQGDSADVYHNDGRVKPETVQWITQQAQQARAQGKQVIALMHHHLLEHFDKEADFLPNYIVANATSLRNQLLQAGIHNVFTGHLHVSDIARDYNDGDSITDVATGSAISYPFHYRTITLNDGSMSINTHSLKSTPGNRLLQAQGKLKVEKQVPALMDAMTRKAWGKVQDKIAGVFSMFGGGKVEFPSNVEGIAYALHKQYDEVAKKGYIAVLEGNEGKNKDSKEIISELEGSIMFALKTTFPSGLGEMVQGFMQENAMPAFENLLLSIFQDRNHCGTEQEVVVNDLKVNLKL